MSEDFTNLDFANFDLDFDVYQIALNCLEHHNLKKIVSDFDNVVKVDPRAESAHIIIVDRILELLNITAKDMTSAYILAFDICLQNADADADADANANADVELYKEALAVEDQTSLKEKVCSLNRIVQNIQSQMGSQAVVLAILGIADHIGINRENRQSKFANAYLICK